MARKRKNARRRSAGKPVRTRQRPSRTEALNDVADEDLLGRLKQWRMQELDARHEVGRYVRAARERGLSWVDVGQALGLSRQGARQRFGLRSDG